MRGGAGQWWCIASFVALVCLASGCDRSSDGFAIYRVAEPSPTSSDSAAETIQELSLEPTPLLVSEDIIRYSRSRHTFEVLEEVTSRFAEDNGRFFVAMVGDERIFVAAYLAPWSSLAYLGTTLRVFPGSPTQLAVMTPPGDPSVPDPMEDTRIREALAAAGVLSE